MHPIAPETFVLQHAVGGGPAPVVHMNAMVIRAAEPVVVDTGFPLHRDEILEEVFALVEPADVRWVFVSHDDVDHYGNAAALLERCPNATLVTSWFIGERLGADLPVPPGRQRWLADGETLDVGDRQLVALRPPLYDSPTTRGLLDPTTGVYWASDCFAAPVEAPTAYASELDPDAWAGGLLTFQAWNSPWARLVDRAAFDAEVDKLAVSGVRTIASCHGPTITEAELATAFDLLKAVPGFEAPPQPSQPPV